jgi:hypothetical protein
MKKNLPPKILILKKEDTFSVMEVWVNATDYIACDPWFDDLGAEDKEKLKISLESLVAHLEDLKNNEEKRLNFNELNKLFHLMDQYFELGGYTDDDCNNGRTFATYLYNFDLELRWFLEQCKEFSIFIKNFIGTTTNENINEK